MRAVIEQLLRPVRRRIGSMLLRGVVKLVHDEAGRQMLQVATHDGAQDKLERFQDYGFTSHPHPQAECLVLALGGQRAHSVAILADDRRYRLRLQQGEVALYDDQGQHVTLMRDGIEAESPFEIRASAPLVTVDCATVTITAAASATITAPITTVEGDLTVTGTITALVDVLAGDDPISLVNHTHGGVMPGPGDTGLPK